ncbi:hypothetical protein EVAR_72004_1 [Eumeta japonica]|uniref:Uncharacterized protein n=1 Tax=Eumeta variegata TaxID=151549 RepID=A0A4C2AH85_EUMVA|nr:hypothetical protein EVAR_72004_1 [Eumeta japonica]
MRTTPTKALFAILNWLPVDLTVRQLAARIALRPGATGMWIPRPWGHASILESTEVRDVITDPIDYCIPKPFHSGEIRQEDRGWNSYLWALHLYVYIRVDPGWEKGLGVAYTLRIECQDVLQTTDGCSVLQAEISTIRRAAKYLMFHRIFEFDILIETDSQAAIKSLTGMYTTSILVQECRASLNEMVRHTNVTLKWVRGHGSDRGNDTGLSLSACWRRIGLSFLKRAQQRWFLRRVTFSDLFELSTVSLGALVSFVRGSGWLEPA